jgi:two-component system response regulator FlrC
VAASETTVMLTGESGTGKDVVARFIHKASARSTGPFVALNCATLPEQLLESELFGYDRGAFTSAQQSKPGLIEFAAGGMLLLDEVSEMSLSAQAKLLRVLQEREFLRLGGTRPIKARARVIVATNRHLQEAVAGGQFRADLYYRVNVFDIHLPPLRERREDILVLARSFLNELARTNGRPVMELTPAASGVLRNHSWPGNVRELRNVLERATIVCEDGLIRVDDLSLVAPPATGVNGGENLKGLERVLIERAMREAEGNKSVAARRLGITRTQLYGRLRKYGLDRPSMPELHQGGPVPLEVTRKG